MLHQQACCSLMKSDWHSFLNMRYSFNLRMHLHSSEPVSQSAILFLRVQHEFSLFFSPFLDSNLKPAGACYFMLCVLRFTEHHRLLLGVLMLGYGVNQEV